MAFENSTIVRAMRPGFRMLEAIAPRAGSVLAERLWCTIPRGRALAAHLRGERFTVGKVVAESWGEGPVVYLMHGWGGSRRQFEPFVGPLLAAGHRVVSLDAPSHGESAPGAFGKRRGLLTEFSDALTAAAGRVGPAHGIVGHSLGGAAAAIAVLDGLAARRIALVNAMASPTPYTVEFARAFGFGERIRTGFLRRLEHRVGRLMSDFDVPVRAAGIKSLPPALIVHDEQDREVHLSDAKVLAAAWPGAELHLTVGLGHNRILRDPAVIARVVEHLVAVRV